MHASKQKVKYLLFPDHRGCSEIRLFHNCHSSHQDFGGNWNASYPLKQQQLMDMQGYLHSLKRSQMPVNKGVDTNVQYVSQELKIREYIKFTKASFWSESFKYFSITIKGFCLMTTQKRKPTRIC